MIRTGDLNLFPVNDPFESVIFQAGVANVDSVIVGGEVLKKDGKLLYPKLAGMKERLAESGRRLLRDAGLRPGA